MLIYHNPTVKLIPAITAPLVSRCHSDSDEKAEYIILFPDNNEADKTLRSAEAYISAWEEEPIHLSVNWRDLITHNFKNHAHAAEVMGITGQSLRNKIKGKTKLFAGEVFRLAKHLGITSDTLYHAAFKSCGQSKRSG